MKLKLSLIASGVLLATQVQATTANYGWEDGATILGSFSASHIEHTNNADQARSGTFALQVNDVDPVDNGTPQSYVGWVHGLSDGDTVTASFWVYDNSGDRPAGRIWGNYTNDITDVTSFAGSAGGNSAYTDGSGWQQVTHSWTFDSDGGSRNGLVVQFRLYDSADFTTGSVWLDDMEITSSAGTIVLPNGEAVTGEDNGGGDGGSGGSNGDDLIISEYIEGSSNNKAIEIYNPTSAAIDLEAGNYQLARYSNGGTNPSNITLTGTVAAGDVFVIANSSSTDAILNVADQTTGSISHNGDDAWELLKSGTVIDSFGQVGNDPGSQWGSGDFGTQNNTLRRVDLTPDTVSNDEFDPSVQWSGHGQDNFDDLGLFNGAGGGGDNGGGDNGGGDTGGTTPECGTTYTTLNMVQGNGIETPLSGNQVEVEAIVTADFQSTLSGFYMQSADADVDSDVMTSEGIFVFTGDSPLTLAVGDRVRLAATAGEFNDMTQLSNVTGMAICSNGNDLPAAVAFNLPLTSEMDAEVLEGMIVSVNDLTVNDTFNLSRFGSATLSNGRRMAPTQVAAPGAAANAVEAMNDLNQVTLDDGSNEQNPDVVPYPAPALSASNSLRVGDMVSFNEGLLHYSFGEFRIHPISDVTITQSNPRTVAPELSSLGNLKVASYNVLNYFVTLNERGADTAEEFQRQKDKIVSALVALDSDVIGLMEVENNGFGPDSAINDLVVALNSVDTGSDWQYVAPERDAIGTDAITVGIIYRSNVVTLDGTPKILDSSNSILDENGDPLFIDRHNRPTMAQSFSLNENGETFVVVVNHLRSKGSSCNSIGDPTLDDGQGACNLTRTKAVQAITSWLSTEYTDQPSLVIGDMNAYVKEDPITAFTNAGYTELFQHFNVDTPYSFIFRGESGQLDHALANAAMLDNIVAVTEWHINTDEPRALDYNTEFKSAEQINSFYSPDAYRSSDHDPVVIAVNLEKPFDPNLTEVAITSVEGLSDQTLRQFTRMQNRWNARIHAWSNQFVKLQDEIELLDPATKQQKITRKQERITQLQARIAIYSDMVEVLSLSTASGTDTSIEVVRQLELNDKTEERMFKRQTRFEQLADTERAAQLEARAAELTAEGKLEKAERKLAKAAALRAKAAVFAKLVEVLDASL